MPTAMLHIRNTKMRFVSRGIRPTYYVTMVSNFSVQKQGRKGNSSDLFRVLASSPTWQIQSKLLHMCLNK